MPIIKHKTETTAEHINTALKFRQRRIAVSAGKMMRLEMSNAPIMHADDDGDCGEHRNDAVYKLRLRYPLRVRRSLVKRQRMSTRIQQNEH